MAQRELRAWHTWRGLPAPDETADPGEPLTVEDRARELTLEARYPRPDPQTPDARLVEFLKCRRSVAYFVDSYCRLRHKERGTIPFRLWRWQAWLLYQWLAHPKSVNLKARQIGVSELGAALGLWLILFYDTKTVIFISKTDDDAMVMLARAKVMLTFLPAFLLPGGSMRRPNAQAVYDTRVVGDNDHSIRLAHIDRSGRPTVSEIESLPQAPNAGRGRTAALVILDEWAAMQHADSIWAGIEPTAEGGGRIVGISTAAGLGNLFWYIYTKSAEGEHSFAPIFLSWRRHPERDADWYEAQRRQKDAENKLHILHQEYPSDALEAFVNTNQPVFDVRVIAAHRERIKAEVAARAAAGLPAWEAVDGLTLYEEADPACEYILSADVAEGKAGGDWNDASVVCRETGREVAWLRGKWKPDQYAAKLDALGYRYGVALLVVERNSIGQTTLLALGNGMAHHEWAGSQTPYPNLYFYINEERLGARQERVAGWPTNVRTKPRVINSLERALREQDAAGLPLYRPRSLRFLDEANAFTRDEHGRMGAPDGLHDDTVMCRAIGVHLLLLPDTVSLKLAFIRNLRERVEADKAAGKLGAYEAARAKTASDAAPSTDTLAAAAANGAVA